ncbi:MAG: hypothetical protein AABX00_04535 [Nanoarchaeota archaeon]
MQKNKRKRIFKSRSGQAALEFLSTYAWAFVAISVTVGALYYFGVFDFGKYIPQKCLFPTQFKCLDFSLKPTQVRVKLLNNIGEDIRVTSISITNDATPPVSCTPPLVPFTWSDSLTQDFLFTSCSSGGYISNEKTELKISMSYYAINTPSMPIHSINGKVNGKITS